jgi:UDP-N-acetylglucosamine diphosphorylase/glucosamine-1-phosphate N-acetyltransferase
MNIILFDDSSRGQLLPLTFTRPVAAIRIGMLTILEKWQYYFPNATLSVATEAYLQEKYPQVQATQNIWINASVLPNADFVSAIQSLTFSEAIVDGDKTLVSISEGMNSALSTKPCSFEYDYLDALPQIFSWNDKESRKDFTLLTAGKKSITTSTTTTIIGDPSQLFLEEGAQIQASIINVSTGPVYLAKDAEIMEGSMIRGPFYLGEHSQTKMGTKIYGATTIGPHSKVGGELNNVVVFGYTNKAHDGFLGNAVIGEWCNIGADSNNSNLKNNYAEVKLWNYQTNNFKRTGLQFCGLIMGDHAKCGINTMFNTGTVVGVGSNVFGSGFPRNFIADFSWGGAQGMEVFAMNKMFEVASKVYERRGIEFNDTEKNILNTIFEQTKEYRKSYE